MDIQITKSTYVVKEPINKHKTNPTAIVAMLKSKHAKKAYSLHYDVIKSRE